MTNIQIEHLSDVKKKVTFEVPGEKVQEMIDAEFRDLKKTVQIKGFRKGKVPLNIIRSYFKDKVAADISRKIIEETFQPGLDEQKIVPVSVLNIDPETLESGKPFKYTAEIEVPPPIDVQGYKGLTLKKYVREVNDKQVDERIEKLRERNARLTPIAESRGITAEDHLVVDVNAEADGEKISLLTVTDYHMELGRDFYLAGFDSKLEGMTPNEVRQFTMDLPQEFPRKELAGKSVSFEVTLKDAKDRVLPELDDDFAKDLGEFETLEAVREEIRKDLKRSLEQKSKKEMEDQILDFLIDRNPFEAPPSMVENQVKLVLEQSVRNLAAYGIDPRRIPEPTDEQRNRVRPSAERTVRAGLILKAIGEKEGIELSEEELEASVAERAEQMGVSGDHYKDQLEQANLLEDFRFGLVQEKVFKFIQENGEITEEQPPAEEDSKKEEIEE